MAKARVKNPAVDLRIVRELETSRTNLVCSVPCSLLAGVLKIIPNKRNMVHLPVTREEEGVGICAGVYLAGGRPAILMQNSGLGNCLNAMMSLTNYYGIGLFLLIGFRGRRGEEEIEAQIPMGDVSLRLLSLAKTEFSVIEEPGQIPKIGQLANRSYEKGKICAALLTPKLFLD